MKRVFTIFLSADGLHQKCFTNVKALFNGIKETEYNPKTIALAGLDDMNYSYINLLRAVKLSQANNRVHMCTLYCDDIATISIQELTITSK